MAMKLEDVTERRDLRNRCGGCARKYETSENLIHLRKVVVGSETIIPLEPGEVFCSLSCLQRSLRKLADDTPERIA